MPPAPQPETNWTSVEADDAALFAGLRSQDEQAARLVCLKFTSLVRRYVLRTLGSGADVEDVVQEVFLNFFRDVQRLREPAKLRYFLMGVAANVTKVERRRRQVRRMVVLCRVDFLPEPAPVAFGLPLLSAPSKKLLDRLSVRDRSVFILRYIEELQIEEIVAATGSSVATVRRRLQHASRRMSEWARREDSE